MLTDNQRNLISAISDAGISDAGKQLLTDYLEFDDSRLTELQRDIADNLTELQRDIAELFATIVNDE